MNLVTYTFLCFGSLFSIVDPFTLVPIFLGLVGHAPKHVQTRAATRASITSFLVLMTFGLVGVYIFRFFGITIPAFKIAGGVLLFGLGLEMMRARHAEERKSEEETREADHKNDVGILPLGIPLLSGPGAIATVMVLSGQAVDYKHRAALCVAIALVGLTSFVILRGASLTTKVLGPTGMSVISRIMGLILAAIAVQFLIDGAREAFPILTTVAPSAASSAAASSGPSNSVSH